MIRPVPAQLPVAEVCRRQTRASLQSGVRRREALITRRHLPVVRPLPPRSIAAVLRHPLLVCGSASHSEPASSPACPSADRMPRGLNRLLRTRPPTDSLRLDFDAADAVFPIPHWCWSPYHFSSFTADFTDAVARTLTLKWYQ